jgi:hypothetical protein
MRTIAWWLAAYWLHISCVNTALESENGSAKAFFRENVPIFLDEIEESWFVFFRTIAPTKVCEQFFGVLPFVEINDIVSRGRQLWVLP